MFLYQKLKKFFSPKSSEQNTNTFIPIEPINFDRILAQRNVIVANDRAITSSLQHFKKDGLRILISKKIEPVLIEIINIANNCIRELHKKYMEALDGYSQISPEEFNTPFFQKKTDELIELQQKLNNVFRVLEKAYDEANLSPNKNVAEEKISLERPQLDGTIETIREESKPRN